MAALRSKHELATVVHRFGRELMAKERLGGVQIKALHNILRCRTAVMGGHEQVCMHCGEKSYSYNSCGDRHCLPRRILQVFSKSVSNVDFSIS